MLIIMRVQLFYEFKFHGHEGYLFGEKLKTLLTRIYGVYVCGFVGAYEQHEANDSRAVKLIGSETHITVLKREFN
jgi:hypothetical protein